MAKPTPYLCIAIGQVRDSLPGISAPRAYLSRNSFIFIPKKCIIYWYF